MIDEPWRAPSSEARSSPTPGRSRSTGSMITSSIVAFTISASTTTTSRVRWLTQTSPTKTPACACGDYRLHSRMFREDYIIRLIQQLVDTIARIAGLNRRGDHDKALAEAEQVWGKLLDAPPDLVDSVDTATLAEMLHSPDKMRVAAQ